ncbi:hypothetical protein F511_44304 [Dorcoceras hygrometricum]|uniref:Uncharacterized protein n=1 Tax=Dorcoceras hygrometricum TaxID=472368 RepID=A0A2Z6ZYL9_9LAMI|nr:hypothetical protein F511_44304 [Dorcoceras hygrometricum]
MAASFFVHAMQVDFASVLSMEHIGMAKLFKSLEDTRLKVFLEASGSVYEGDVVEFFANVKVVAVTIISFVANRKLALTKDVFSETFGLPTVFLIFRPRPWQKCEQSFLCRSQSELGTEPVAENGGDGA